MENHPIPQNVTGFQFKLIGDMTVKQFAYLAAGSIVAGIFMFGTSFNFVLIKFPIIAFSLGLGLGLAFLPIHGRPLDIMLVNFIKALFVPSQFVYQKTGGQLIMPAFIKKPQAAQNIASSHSNKDLQALLNTLPKKAQNELDEKETTFLKSVFTSGTATNPQMPQKHSQPQILSMFHQLQPFKKDEEKNENLPEDKQEEIVEEKKEVIEGQTSEIQKELDLAKTMEVTSTNQANFQEAHKKVLDLEGQLRESLLQKQELEKKLAELTQKLQAQPLQNVFNPTTAMPKTETQNVRKVPADMAPKTGFPIIPDVPNLIIGIVKDSRGNILTNILIEVLDKDQSPIRAFKTNSLGQFASATPLLNGTYTLVFEDPQNQHKFDNIEITAEGKIIPPLEVISIDAREELRKELFG